MTDAFMGLLQRPDIHPDVWKIAPVFVKSVQCVFCKKFTADGDTTTGLCVLPCAHFAHSQCFQDARLPSDTIDCPECCETIDLSQYLSKLPSVVVTDRGTLKRLTTVFFGKCDICERKNKAIQLGRRRVCEACFKNWCTEQLKDYKIELESAYCYYCQRDNNIRDKLFAPRILPCGHVGCLDCLIRHFSTFEYYMVKCAECQDECLMEHHDPWLLPDFTVVDRKPEQCGNLCTNIPKDNAGTSCKACITRKLVDNQRPGMHDYNNYQQTILQDCHYQWFLTVTIGMRLGQWNTPAAEHSALQESHTRLCSAIEEYHNLLNITRNWRVALEMAEVAKDCSGLKRYATMYKALDITWGWLRDDIIVASRKIRKWKH